MKVTKKNIEDIFPFDSLSVGDVFLYNGRVLMKTYEFSTGDFPTNLHNAMNIENGTMYYIDKGERVRKVSAEVIITRYSEE